MTPTQIDALTPAGLYIEFSRLMAAHGGNVKVELGPDLANTRPRTAYEIFTSASQHVAAYTFDDAVKKALIMESFHQEAGHFTNWDQLREWLDKYQVPERLRH